MDSYKIVDKIVDKAKKDAREKGYKKDCETAYAFGVLKGLLSAIIMNMQGGYVEYRLKKLKEEYGDE